MALPHVPYAADTTAQMSFLDDTFNALGNFVIIPCTAAGTNNIALTPISGAPAITTLTNQMVFSFKSVNNSTGALTATIAGLSAVKVFLPDGTTQGSNGTILANRSYFIQVDTALDGGNGGVVLMAPAVPGSIPAQNFALTSASYANQGAINTYLMGNAAGNLAFSPVSLASGVTGFLQATNVNSGIGASASTVLAGDMSWHPKPYGIGVYVPGSLVSSAGGQRLVRHTVGIPFTLPANLTSSAASADTAALSACALIIKNQTTGIGIITFASGATTGTFTFSSQQTFAIGNALIIDGPVAADSTLAGVSITIFGFQNI